MSHFHLVILLRERIVRVVNVSSIGILFGNGDYEDYNFSDGKTYDPWVAYGQSKVANVLFTKALAARGVAGVRATAPCIRSTMVRPLLAHPVLH